MLNDIYTILLGLYCDVGQSNLLKPIENSMHTQQCGITDLPQVTYVERGAPVNPFSPGLVARIPHKPGVQLKAWCLKPAPGCCYYLQEGHLGSSECSNAELNGGFVATTCYSVVMHTCHVFIPLRPHLLSFHPHSQCPPGSLTWPAAPRGRSPPERRSLGQTGGRPSWALERQTERPLRTERPATLPPHRWQGDRGGSGSLRRFDSGQPLSNPEKAPLVTWRPAVRKRYTLKTT